MGRSFRLLALYSRSMRVCNNLKISRLWLCFVLLSIGSWPEMVKLNWHVRRTDCGVVKYALPELWLP